MPEEFDFCRPYLEPGEYILWKGRPERGFAVTPGEKWDMRIGLSWCGGAVLWMAVAFFNRASGHQLLYGLIFFCLGLFWLMGQPLWALWARRRTAYVITNKRIFRRRGQRVDMLEGSAMPSTHLVIHKNGNGTIQFGRQMEYRYDTFGRRRMYINRHLFALENLARAEQVQQILTQVER